MLDYIYEWMENIAFYMVLIVAIVQILPDNSYKKYVRFFAGLILILMMTGPVLKIFNMEEYQSTEYQKEMEEIQEVIKDMEGIIGK